MDSSSEAKQYIVPFDKKLKRSREQCHENAETEVMITRSTEKGLKKYSHTKAEQYDEEKDL
ncbi:uncharacterized protein Bfra_012466 [Botrytis fragariae]|uniref:Uncharacterized protein n=1 Tax=Botrytis fragariae TaxID=1964551 RepID=A0A8H6AIP4_9HELO|nr:uncharacterized protein Bfra_012466 [Botrytis fragariae]KAF5868372.1 hypothetical protein Bfra_012466 [Botrytis fragariae]